MVNDGIFWALAGTAAAVGALHSLAPDHWVPFMAVGRAREWSAARTARVTLLCGLLDRFGDALAGGLIVVTGLAVAALGW